MLTLPGLIDTHVHLREPGATQKEDFETGTKAAIAGGYTLVLDMPNNPEPTITPEAVDKKINLAQGVILNEVKDLSRMRVPNKLGDSSLIAQNDSRRRIYCDVGFHFGATLDSSQYFNQVKDKVFGLKIYMNHTTGTLLQEDPQILNTIFESWPKDKVLMVHAEGETLAKAIDLARKYSKKLHVCHVSKAYEISLIRQAKANGLSITSEVTPHHLFLTDEDLEQLGSFGIMRPPLATKDDQNALWAGIADGTVDIIASDHAPHTKEEKANIPPPNGVPGLETILPLLLTAVNEGSLTVDDIIRLCHINPAKIFNIPTDENTYVEVNPDEQYTINDKLLYTKCGWSPFEGKRVTGIIKRVILRGQIVFKDGEFLNPPQGKVVYPTVGIGFSSSLSELGVEDPPARE